MRKRVAWFTPLDFERETNSISAYFSETMLPLMSIKYEIDVFHEGFASHPNFKTSNYLSAFAKQKACPYDIFFYQVEDKRASDFIRVHLGLIPGIVLFHDLLFSTKGPPGILSTPWCDDLYGADLDWVRSPLGYREAGLANTLLFSDPRQCEEYKRSISPNFPEKACYYLPHPAVGKSKLPGSSNTVALCASTRIEQRAHKVLEALAQMPQTKLLWMVPLAEAGKARELIAEFGVVNCELVTDSTPANWTAVVERSSVAIHALFSVWGQAGPYLELSIASGTPSVVINFASSDYLPDGLVFKVDPGRGEVVEMQMAIGAALESASRPEFQLQLRNFANQCFEPKIVADELSAVFERHSQDLRRSLLSREVLLENERMKLFAELQNSFCDLNISERIAPFPSTGWLL